MFGFGLRHAALSARYCIRIFARTALIGGLLACAGCAEGVPPFGLVETDSNLGTGGASGAGVSGMGVSGSGGSAAGGSGGSSGSGGSGGSAPMPCVVAMCPEPPPPFPFTPAPPKCCKPDETCGGVDFFGGCS